MVHILLIVFTTMQVMLTLQGQSNLTRTQERSFGHLFFDEGMDFSDLDHPRIRNFYTVPEFRSFVLTSLENYRTINQKSLVYYEYQYAGPGRILPVEV